MERRLRVQRVAQQPALPVIERNAGLVARSFDAQYQHGINLKISSAHDPPIPIRFSGRGRCGRRQLPRKMLSKQVSVDIIQVFPEPEPMPTVRVKENEPFEAALRRFKRTVEKTGLLTELRAREYYEKPTTERKRKLAAAIKRHHKRLRSQLLPPRMY